MEQVDMPPTSVVAQEQSYAKPSTSTLPHTPVTVKPKPAYDFVKRLFDIVVSLICLTVGLPVYLIIALAIVIDDPGNPLFIQNHAQRRRTDKGQPGRAERVQIRAF